MGRVPYSPKPLETSEKCGFAGAFRRAAGSELALRSSGAAQHDVLPVQAREHREAGG